MHARVIVSLVPQGGFDSIIGVQSKYSKRFSKIRPEAEFLKIFSGPGCATGSATSWRGWWVGTPRMFNGPQLPTMAGLGPQLPTMPGHSPLPTMAGHGPQLRSKIEYDVVVENCSASATLIWGSKTARQAQIICMDAC